MPFVIGPATPPPAGAHGLRDTLVSMLGSARHYLARAIRDLPAASLDAAPAGAPNTVGALLAHLMAAERMFQNLTFRGFTFQDSGDEVDKAAFRFEANPLAGEDVAAYLARMAEIRAETVRLLDGVDDTWLGGPMTFSGQPANRHYYWFHYIQDEVRHTGQIILIRKHLLPGADGSFNPYARA